MFEIGGSYCHQSQVCESLPQGDFSKRVENDVLGNRGLRSASARCLNRVARLSFPLPSEESAWWPLKRWVSSAKVTWQCIEAEVIPISLKLQLDD